MIVVKNNNFFIGTNLRNLQPTNKETFCEFLENFEWVSSSLSSVFLIRIHHSLVFVLVIY